MKPTPQFLFIKSSKNSEMFQFKSVYWNQDGKHIKMSTNTPTLHTDKNMVFNLPTLKILTKVYNVVLIKCLMTPPGESFFLNSIAHENSLYYL